MAASSHRAFCPSAPSRRRQRAARTAARARARVRLHSAVGKAASRVRSRSRSATDSSNRTERWSRCGVSSQEPEPLPYDGVAVHVGRRGRDAARARLRRRVTGFRRPRARLRRRHDPAGQVAPRRGDAPGGSIVALDGDRVVGYAGLIAWNDDDTRAEHGADRGRPGLASARARDRAQAAAARLGRRERNPRARHLDADGERGHAERQRAARLRDADGQPHACGASLCRSDTASRLPRVVPASV